jgi:hypothetical protein
VWTKIGFVNSKASDGNSKERLSYSYTDQAPLNGTNYYRLKQTDLDDKYNYSTVKQLSFGNRNTISIHPNPAKDYVIIDGLNGDEMIKIYDATGRIVKEIKAASSSVAIRLDTLNEGLYQVSIISTNGNTLSRKIMKTK